MNWHTEKSNASVIGLRIWYQQHFSVLSKFIERHTLASSLPIGETFHLYTAFLIGFGVTVAWGGGGHQALTVGLWAEAKEDERKYKWVFTLPLIKKRLNIYQHGYLKRIMKALLYKNASGTEPNGPGNPRCWNMGLCFAGRSVYNYNSNYRTLINVNKAPNDFIKFSEYLYYLKTISIY